MGKLDQLVKSVFLEETPKIVGDRLVFTVPAETPTTAVTADGLLAVVRPEDVGQLPAPWRLAEGPEVVLEFKMQRDKVDRLALERARLRTQARQVYRAEHMPEDTRRISLWCVSGYLPPWLRAEEPERVEAGVYGLAGERVWWIASNELPLDPALIPFLVTRTGRRLAELLDWLLDIRPELCQILIEVVPMSTPEYESYEEQVEAISDEEHERRLTAFLTRMAEKRGIVRGAELGILRQSVLDVLAARGLPVSDAERQNVLGEEDAATLRRWLTRAALATTAADAVGGE